MDCIFCRIVKGEIPADKVYEDDKVIAINDIDPQAPVHILILPKQHIKSLLEVNKENEDILSHIMSVSVQLAIKKGVADEGFRIVNNCGEKGGQTVDHIHFHLLGGRHMGWPPG